MPEANLRNNYKVEWSTDHCDGKGNLISRQVSIESPQLTCIKPKCILKYLGKCFAHAAIQMYHAERVKYAEKHRHDVIDEKYRTGTPSPETFREAISETAKIGR